MIRYVNYYYVDIVSKLLYPILPTMNNIWPAQLLHQSVVKMS
jgi:hypothetical protein